MVPHILIFDSGIGGTSVLSHVRSTLPFANVSYVMDNALLPYGLQSQETIVERLKGLLKPAMPWCEQIDLIVIACNTASTQALAILREHTDIPIVGVVPAIKPAAMQTQTGRIALLATPATVKNQYTHNLIKEFAAGCHVDLHASTELVCLAEQFYWCNADITQSVHNELRRIAFHHDVDHIVLGCTHFPIISEAIASYFDTKVVLLDSGAAIARRVSFLLNEMGFTNDEHKKGFVHYYATKPVTDTNKKMHVITCISL